MFKELKQKTRDAEVYNALKQGKFEWQKDISVRFMQQLLDVVNYRFSIAKNQLQNDLTTVLGQDNLLIQALNTFRRESEFLHEVLNLPVIPQKERERYRSFFREQVDKVQSVLENIGNTDRNGKLLMVIRSNAVNRTN
ncbi:MAG: hypothetical protein FWE57_08325 [Chitinispirillia bacterium]|nr:hypothetical protein [Chitinispirillia bacterium]